MYSLIVTLSLLSVLLVSANASPFCTSACKRAEENSLDSETASKLAMICNTCLTDIRYIRKSKNESPRKEEYPVLIPEKQNEARGYKNRFSVFYI